MANIAGLTALAAGMQGYFTKYAIDTVVAFGWRARSEILNQGPGGANRIVIIPGDPKSGKAGPLKRGRQAQTNPRVLFEWDALATMSIWGVDTNDTNDEKLQYAATVALLELAVRALQNAVEPTTMTPVGVANLTLGEPSWSVDNTEMYFGRELLLPITQKGPLLDRPISTIIPTPVVNRGTVT